MHSFSLWGHECVSVDIYGVSFGVKNYPEGFSVLWESPRSIYSRDLKRGRHSGCLGGLDWDLEIWNCWHSETGSLHHGLLTRWGKKTPPVERKEVCQWADEEWEQWQEEGPFSKVTSIIAEYKGRVGLARFWRPGDPTIANNPQASQEKSTFILKTGNSPSPHVSAPLSLDR